jgi:molybdopterin-guanine dinucleotide biosynthesis protein A
VDQPAIGAVVLAGGNGNRMGGVDKGSLRLGGVSLLEHALAATAAAQQTVVVGDPAPASRRVTWTRERPAGGGPAAGLLAGLEALAREPDLVLVLAVDMPWVTAATADRLVEAVRRRGTAVDGAVLVDADGRLQPLAAAYRPTALQRSRDPIAAGGLSMRRLLAGLRLCEVPAVGDEARDVDTWRDLRRDTS